VEAAALLLLLARRDGEERRRSEAARRGEGIVVDGTQAARGRAAPGRCGGQAWAGVRGEVMAAVTERRRLPRSGQAGLGGRDARDRVRIGSRATGRATQPHAREHRASPS
jgi:hypothetical protein